MLCNGIVLASSLWARWPLETLSRPGRAIFVPSLTDLTSPSSKLYIRSNHFEYSHQVIYLNTKSSPRDAMTQFWPSSCRYKQAEHMNHADPWPSNTDHLDHTTTVKSSLLVTQTELNPDRISPSHHLQRYLSSEKAGHWTARYDCNRNTNMNQVTLACY